MVDRAWTLTSMGKHKHLEEAEELFARAWELRHYQEPLFQINLARNIAVLRIQQQKFDEAQTWLTQMIELLQQTQLDEQQRLRQLLHMLLKFVHQPISSLKSSPYVATKR